MDDDEEEAASGVAEPHLRAELLAMGAEDQRVRAELAADELLPTRSSDRLAARSPAR